MHSHPYCDVHIPNDFSDRIEKDDEIYGDWNFVSTNSKNLYLAAPDGNLYIMRWDAKEYNQSLVRSGLPIDDTVEKCVF